jgi:hypothetical protein
VEDGYCVNKKKLIDVFKDEYLPLYHVRMKPYFILQTLAKNKCIKRKKKKATQETILFSTSKVQEIVSSHGGRVQGNMISSNS